MAAAFALESRPMPRTNRPVLPRNASASTGTLATLFDGRVRLERLPTTRNLSARVFIQGKYVRRSTGESTLNAAKKVATEWYTTLLARQRLGERVHSSSFSDCAEKFLRKVEQRFSSGEISHGQWRNYQDKWSLLKPMIGSTPIVDINTEFLQQFRQKRMTAKSPRGGTLSASTLKKDFVFIHGVLKHAKKHLNAIVEVPDIPAFEGKWSVQRRGRPFLTEAEYKTLHQLARRQCAEEGVNPRARRQRQELYWFILLSVGGALRVGEAESIRWCDCTMTSLTLPDGSKTDAVRIMVLGKHSRGGFREEAVVMYGGVHAYRELLASRPADWGAEDRIFQESHREGMKRLLKDAGLYTYRDPRTGETLTRDRKSLRPTGITLRLDRGNNVNYRDIAKWARTSVAMVGDFYDQTNGSAAAARVAGFKAREKPRSGTSGQSK